MDQKSKRIENLVTQIISRLLYIGDSYEIKTPSFYMNHFILNVSNDSFSKKEVSFQSGTFKLPSLCDLNSQYLNCTNLNAIILKVMHFYVYKIKIFKIQLVLYLLKLKALPMAVSGYNGMNETSTGMSSSLGLSIYDYETNNEILISQSLSPIDIIIPRDKSASKHSFQYVNTTSLDFTNGSFYLQNYMNITRNNVSIHIELKPLNESVSYLVVLKLGHLPIINSTYADFTSFEFICSGKFRLTIFLKDL